MSDDDSKTARGERLRLLTQTSRDSVMGRLLRRFWQPFAVSRDLRPGAAKRVKVLGEDLTLYRGDSGRPYLVGGRCAHRLTLLHSGWVQGEDLRCIYHGWVYDGTGQCVERPAESDDGTPKVRIAGYPLHEYAGLIFAYMGEGNAPAFDLPRKDAFERPGGITHAKIEIWPCNWLQMVENSLDAVHVSFVHQAGSVGTFGQAVTRSIPTLEYHETDAGVRQIATRARNHVRVSDWTFPNNNHISQPGLTKDDPWIDVGVWMVPLDDGATARAMVWSVPTTTPENDRRFVAYCDKYGAYNPADHHAELFDQGRYPDDVLMQLTSAQDYIAQIGQGAIADRENEYLGRSDAGVVFVRRLFQRDMDAIRAGREPKAWRRLPHAAELPVQAPEAVAG
ncbi:MAG TPA: Rieske 2Fe-2S domain-containing protein [Stellaceae bacterium]|nr:Rieske 2Fe-2S domain-containing protein [Stellaceae bacterium]